MEPHASREACLRLTTALARHSPDDEHAKARYSTILSALSSAAGGTDDQESGIEAALAELAQYLDQTVRSWMTGERQVEILHTLADTTRREPYWRPLFGLLSRPEPKSNSLHMENKLPSDCILEVARRIISEPPDDSSTRSYEIRSALRLIANCCADNNVNRCVIVDRGGVEAMMQMARSQRECDLLIPTLYNLCVDYDQPAAAEDGTPWPPLRQMRPSAEIEDEDSSATDFSVNVAQQRLGSFWTPSDLRTSVEILLATKEHASQCLGTLADLIEMASRVALYGLPRLVRSRVPGTPVTEVDATRLIDSLLTQGADIAAGEDVDCRISICQAILNVLSQRDCHSALVTLDGAIWTLIHLPYMEYSASTETSQMEDGESEEQLQPYRKAIIKVAYEVSGLEIYGQTITSTSKLFKDCIDAMEGYHKRPDHTQEPWASICVLLSNSVTSTDRAMHLVRSTNIVKDITTLLNLHPLSDPDTLLPATDLATRLALCREGQDAFHATRAMPSVLKFLSTVGPVSEVDAIRTDIMRETVSLVRLLIKGRGEFLGDLGMQHDSHSIITRIITLFRLTGDARTKIEVGRLSIEVLRTIFSSTTTSPSASQNLNHDLEARVVSIFGNSTSSLESHSIADTISSIITQSPPSPQHPPSSSSSTSSTQQIQSEAEAWFGLGLLSTLPCTHDSIRATLARDDARLLTRLREIASSSPSSSSSSTSIENQNSSRDPRLENVKVVVANLLQQTKDTETSHALASGTTPYPASEAQATESNPRPPSSSSAPLHTSSLATMTARETNTTLVQRGLEAATRELGMSSVLP